MSGMSAKIRKVGKLNMYNIMYTSLFYLQVMVNGGYVSTVMIRKRMWECDVYKLIEI